MAHRVLRRDGKVFRAMWIDPRVPIAEIHAQFDVRDRDTLHRWARMLGLPPRKPGTPHIVRDVALMRDMWDAGVLGPDIAAHFGIAYTTLLVNAKTFGFARRPKGTGCRYQLSLDRYLAGIRIGGEDFAQMWRDGVGIASLEAHYGMERRGLTRLALSMGLPKRGPGDWRGHITVEAWQAARASERAQGSLASCSLTMPQCVAGVRSAGLFQAMWSDEVQTASIAAHFGVRADTVRCWAKRLGLPSRPSGRRLGGRPTVAKWLADRQSHAAQDALRAAMAADARATQDALRARDMVDIVVQRRAA